MFTSHYRLTQSLRKLSLVCLVLGCLFIINPQWVAAKDNPNKGAHGKQSATSPTPTTSPSTGGLTFTAAQGGANPAAQTLSIANTGGGTLSWTASEPATWLSLSPASGAIAAGQSNVITVSVNIAGLTANTYSSTITISAPGSTNPTQQIPATLTVSPSLPIIGLTTLPFSFMMMQGTTASSSQTFNITNTGQGTLNWTASASASWLSISPTSGATTTQPDVITVTVNPTGLTSNVYTAPVTISASGATNSPQQELVTLVITAPASGRATLTWAPETDPSVKGYKVYSGTSSGAYGAPVDVGNVTTFQIFNLQSGNTYYFAVTAYNSAGESGYSNEVSKRIP